MTHQSRRERRVAVLGAGMMGSCVALLLACKGVRVTLFDAAAQPINGASRWNEGKIHLGYIYSGDRSLETARKLAPGGLAFQSAVEKLIGVSLEPHMTSGGDLFLNHGASVVDAEDTHRHLDATWELLSELHATHRKPKRLTAAELADVTASPDIVAGFSVDERSVHAPWLADRMAERVASDPGIELHCNCRVTSLTQDEGDRWRVVAGGASFGGFDAVVNALWEGRSMIDAAAGHAVLPLSYRYRVAVFMTLPQTDLRNTILTTGPFGDVKNYDGRHIFLSWYPVGLMLDRHTLHAPAPPKIDAATEREIFEQTVHAMSGFFPVIASLATEAEEWSVRGGWIVAQGEGVLSDGRSTLHRRDRFGISRHSGYYSVDTGKYSVAPWLAGQIADEIAG